MAYPANLIYTKLTFSWTGGGMSEIQEFGFWQTHTGTPSWATDLQTLADGTRDAWNTNFGSVASWFSNAINGVKVACYEMDSTLHAVSSASSAFSSGHTFHGTDSTGLPPQDTVVITLYCDDPAHFVGHRARRRGRFYLPTMGASQLNGQGYLGTSTVAGILGQAKAFVQDVDNIGLSGSGKPPIGVLSRADVNWREAAFIGCGRIIDTQRRRRNKLSEAYVTDTL